MFSETVQNSTAQDSPLDKMGIQYTTEMTTGLPKKPDETEQMLHVTVESQQSTEEKTQSGEKIKQTSNITTGNFIDNDRTKHESGADSTVDIDKQTLQMFDASRTTEGHSQLGDRKSQTTIDGIKDSIVEGTMKTQTLSQNGKETTAQLHKEKSNEIHITGENERTFRTGRGSSVTVENEFDQSTRNSTETNIDENELIRKNKYSDIKVRNKLDTTNTTQATTSSHTQNTAVNTPQSQSKSRARLTETKTGTSSITKEKTTVVYQTPLSKLLIKDYNKEQTKNDHIQATTNSVTTTDDRKGTKVTTTVNTANKTDKKTAQHFGELKLQKTPTEGSKSLPLSLILSANGIDKEQLNAETKIDKSENTKTPDGKKDIQYNKYVITEYAFETMPSTKNSEQNKATVTKTAEKPIGDISLGINSISQLQPSQPSAQITPQNIIGTLARTDNETSKLSDSIDEEFLPLKLLTDEISPTDGNAQSILEQDETEPQPTLIPVQTFPQPIKFEQSVQEPKTIVQQPEQVEHNVTLIPVQTFPQPIKIEQSVQQPKNIVQQPGQIEQSVQQPEKIEKTIPLPVKLEEKNDVSGKGATRQGTNKEDKQPNEIEKKTGAEDYQHSVKADNINVNYGTMILLLPRTQTDDKNLFIESIAQKYTDFIYYIQKHKLASKLLFAEVGNVTSDQSDEFLYTFSRERNVYVADIDPFMETVEIDQLSSQKTIDTSREEDESSNETVSWAM